MQLITLRGHGTWRTAVLREVGRWLSSITSWRRCGVQSGAQGSLWRVLLKLTGRRTIFAPLEESEYGKKNRSGNKTYRAFQRAAIDIVARQLTDRHSSIFMGVHLDECKAAVGLEAGFNDIAKVLE
jgi:hypothetical protein